MATAATAMCRSDNGCEPERGASPYDLVMRASVVGSQRAQRVPLGPRAYRYRLRTLGPLAALVIPACIGLGATVALHGSTSTARGVGGFVLAVLAAPALLVAGAPLRSGTGLYLAAAIASALLWMALGAVAAHRATRRPVATWRDFWHEFAWLMAGVWAGVVVGLLAANLILGQALL